MKLPSSWLVLSLSMILTACGDGCSPPSEGEGESSEGEGDANEGEGDGAEGEGSEGEGEPPFVCVRNGCDDCDQDGFFTCIDPAFPNRPPVIDCNDDAFSAQPGGVEFADNDVDDDCDTLVDEVDSCPCGDDGTAASLADAVGGCGQRGRVNSLGVQGQRQVGTDYFGVEARSGGCLLATSTGVIDYTNPSSWPLQIDDRLVVRSRALDVSFVAVGDVSCRLEDGTVIEPCVSPLQVDDFGNPGAHVLTIAATNEDSSGQPVDIVVPVFVSDDDQPRLLWPDGDVVGTRPRLAGLGGFGATTVDVTNSDGAIRSATPTVDDAGQWSIDGTDLSAALTDGEWTVAIGSTIVGTITVVTDGDNGPPTSSITAEQGRVTIASPRAEELVCALDGEPVPCRRGSNNFMATPGLHVLSIEAIDIEGVAEVQPRTFFVRVPWDENPRTTLPAPTGNEAQPIIAGFANPFTSINVTVDGFAVSVPQFFGSSAVADVMGRWVVPADAVPQLTPGNHTITVSIDFGAPTSRSYTYDPAAPSSGAIAYLLGPLTSAGPDSTTVGLQTQHPISGAVINDVVGLRIQLQVPTNARGLAIDTMFISAEWPEFLCSDFNDSLDIYLVSGATAGQPSNIALDPNRAPLTVNNGYFELPTAWTTDLSGLVQTEVTDPFFGGQCGFPIDDTCTLPDYCDGSDPAALAYRGSGTGWLVAQGPVEPGETMEALFLVADVGDSALDSLMLLSGLRWLPQPPPPGVLKPAEE
jgi:hypothetical protein